MYSHYCRFICGWLLWYFSYFCVFVYKKEVIYTSSWKVTSYYPHRNIFKGFMTSYLFICHYSWVVDLNKESLKWAWVLCDNTGTFLTFLNIHKDIWSFSFHFLCIIFPHCVIIPVLYSDEFNRYISMLPGKYNFLGWKLCSRIGVWWVQLIDNIRYELYPETPEITLLPFF